jgi:phosphoribosylglycinamide formyltransferase-1
MPSGDKKHIAIFASGAGSNADQICTYFHQHPQANVNLIISNRRAAGVLDVAKRHGIEAAYIPKNIWSASKLVLEILDHHDITHIVLAGFLLLLPEWLIEKYKGRILNIHPALLPKHGGTGMYGHHVHQAVKSSGDLVSGITIHEVNANYDEGKIIFQQEVMLNEHDEAGDIARKVLALEHKHYPQVIETWINS